MVQRHIPAGSLYLYGFLEFVSQANKFRARPVTTQTKKAKTPVVESRAHSDPVSGRVERDERSQHDVDFLRSAKSSGRTHRLGNSESIGRKRGFCAILRKSQLAAADDRQIHLTSSPQCVGDEIVAIDFTADREIRCDSPRTRHERLSPEFRCNIHGQFRYAIRGKFCAPLAMRCADGCGVHVRTPSFAEPSNDVRGEVPPACAVMNHLLSNQSGRWDQP